MECLFGAWWLEKLWLPIVVGAVMVTIATMMAYAFTERWQRKRVQRELQFRVITDFSDTAHRVLGGLSALFPAVRSGVEQEAQLREKGLHISRDIASITSEVYRFSLFDNPLIVSSLVAMVESAKETFRICLTPDTPESNFVSAFECLLGHTQTVMKEGYRVMGFLTSKQESMMEQTVAKWATSRP